MNITLPTEAERGHYTDQHLQDWYAYNAANNPTAAVYIRLLAAERAEVARLKQLRVDASDIVLDLQCQARDAGVLAERERMARQLAERDRQIAALRAALEPFAEHSKALDDRYQFWDDDDSASNVIGLKVGHCREAARVLAETAPKEEK